MTTRTTRTTHATQTVSQATVAASTEVAAPSHAPAPTATAPASVTPAAPIASTASASPVTFLAPPPASANIPSVPDGFVPTSGANYRGVQPRKVELVALPLASRDLASFKNYATVIGATAPPLEEVQQIFGVTGAWSMMRNASTAWDAYAREQEGIAWTVMRTTMGRLKPAFMLAARTNPSIATTYAGLAALLGAKSVIARKSVATKKKNKQDEAEGKMPTAGLVGKKRGKAAAKAALAAQNAGAQPAGGGANAAAVPVVAPVGVQAAVVPAPAAGGEVVAVPVGSGAPAGNGVSHS